MSTTRSLTFVQQEIDIEAMRRFRPDALDGDVVCFDPALHFFLSELGINHHVASDFVPETERDELRGLFDRLWTAWKGFLDPPIQYRGINPFALAPARHICCLRRVAYCLLAIRRGIVGLRPNDLVGFLEHDVHGLEQPTGANRRMPLVQGLAQFEAMARGIPYASIDRRGIPGHVPWADVKSPQAGPETRHRRPFRRAAGKPLVIVAGNGRELLQQRPVVQELRRLGEVQVLHLALVMDPKTRTDLEQKTHTFHELPDVEPRPPVVAAQPVLREAASCRTAARRETPSDLRAFFDNPFIESHFDFLLGTYLERMLIQIERWTRLLHNWSPDLVVVNWDLPMAGVARARGVPVLAMLHSIMSPIDPVYHHWAHSELAVLSSEQVARASEAGTPPENVRATGHPDSDTIFQLAAESALERDQRRDKLYRDLSIDPRRRCVLLLSTYIDCVTSSAAWFPNVDMRRAMESWREIARMADRHPDWHFIVKGHPRSDHLHVYRSIFSNRLHRNVTIPDDLTLADVAPATDAAVVCNATTSAQLETCFWKLPVVLLDDARCWLGRRARDGFPGWPRVESVAQLEEWLERTLGDRSIWREQQEATLRACEAFTGPRDGHAANRVATYVHEIVAARVPTAALATQERHDRNCD